MLSHSPAGLRPTPKPGNLYTSCSCRPCPIHCLLYSVTWKRTGSQVVLASSGGELTLPSLTREEGGAYSCQGENSLGLSEASTQVVQVEWPPGRLKVGPRPLVQRKRGGPLSLTCTCDSLPPPSYTWLKDGQVNIGLRISRYSHSPGDFHRPDWNNGDRQTGIQSCWGLGMQGLALQCTGNEHS